MFCLCLQNLQKLRPSVDKRRAAGEEEDMDVDSESSELLRLMARHSELSDLLHAHHLIGGYDVIKTRQGKGMCFSLATAYEGVYLDTYNLEIDLRPKARITRHNIPPFIPLNNLAEQSDLQTGLRAFLDTVSQHLNAFAGRKQQLKLVKEQHKSVEVMESNLLCSILVLMFTVPKEKTPLLCTISASPRASRRRLASCLSAIESIVVMFLISLNDIPLWMLHLCPAELCGGADQVRLCSGTSFPL
ncbi:hypothetical protein GOODEAATRI_028418 [Goodea atripinnis]|uniref:Centromere protein O n=1 Tax=Goodea atripinnis TaxID=208336 RepID=A0ABV0NEB5_9TELE